MTLPGYQPTYEDNYLLFYNGSSDYYARVTCTLRQYDSQDYFKQDYQFDTIRYIPPHSYWALSTSLTQDVLQYCKILNIISQVLPTTSATLQYCEFQAVGEFTVNNVNLLDANMTGVVENNSAFTPSMVSIQTLFYDQFDAIVAIRNNLLASPYPPPMEKKQFTTTVNPVPQFTHTMTTIIATR